MFAMRWGQVHPSPWILGGFSRKKSMNKPNTLFLNLTILPSYANTCNVTYSGPETIIKRQRLIWGELGLNFEIQSWTTFPPNAQVLIHLLGTNVHLNISATQLRESCSKTTLQTGNCIFERKMTKTNKKFMCFPAK